MRGLQERGLVAALTPVPGGGDVPGGAGATGGEPVGTGAEPVRRLRRLATALGVAAVVVAADQVTKSLAVSHLTRAVHLLGPFGLSLGYNSGTAFSLFTGSAAVIVPIAVVLVAALVWLAWRSASTGLAIALGLVLGGALGNLADRALRGHHGEVVDFVTFPHWPTFNVADACITVGVVLAAVFYWRGAPGGPDQTGPEGTR